jgi:hypothetical protein
MLSHWQRDLTQLLSLNVTQGLTNSHSISQQDVTQCHSLIVTNTEAMAAATLLLSMAEVVSVR